MKIPLDKLLLKKLYYKNLYVLWRCNEMKKSIISIISIVSVLITSFSVSAAEVPREWAPCNATNEAIVLVESYIEDILTEVQNGLGYADARAKSNRIFFDGWLNGQTNGYSYGELVDIANAAIWQYRDMYLRPDFYANNLEKVRVIIAPVIEDYKFGKITYAEAEFNARNRIYQSVKPDFDPDVEYMKDAHTVKVLRWVMPSLRPLHNAVEVSVTSK